MNIAFIGKIAGGFLFSSGSVALIAYMVVTHMDVSLGEDADTINVFAINKTEGYNAATELIHNSGTEKANYMCKFGSSHYECKISAAENFDTTKKWVDIYGLMKNGSVNNLQKSSFQTKNSIYKIQINKSINNWNTSVDSKIEIVLNNDRTKKYVSLDTLFAIEKESVDKHTKTEYFIVKTTTAVITSETATYKCLTSDKTIDTTTNASESCDVYDFANNSTGTTLNDLTFKKIAGTTSVQMAKSNYYVIKLKEKKEASKVKFMKIQQNNNATINLEDKIIAAIYTTDKEDNIFILDKVNTN